MRRLFFLFMATLVISSAVVLNAYSKKEQFYPTMIYLTKSSRTMAILYIQAFLVSLVLFQLVKLVFFGTLRHIEVEHLIEKSWFAVIDTFILLAAFHEELSPFFVAMVALLFGVKILHWLISDRVDHMEQSPIITYKFHIRSIILLSSLCAIDVIFIRRSWLNVKAKGMSVDIAFGLEYAIMLIEVLNIYVRYILHSIDLRSDNPWENKPIYIRYVNIGLGILELLLYAGYMAFMLMIPFIPLHIARRVYRTARDFQRSVYEVVTSHQAIRNLNTLYPDATAEELQATNSVCIICREEMINTCKKLPCNHIFHTNCLRSWFQRQHTCPTCRLDVLRAHRTNNTNNGSQQQRTNDRQHQPPAPGPGLHQNPMFPPPPMMGWAPFIPPMQHPPPPQARPPRDNQAEPRVQDTNNNDTPPDTPPAGQNEPTTPPPNTRPPVLLPPFGPPPFMMPFAPPILGMPPPPPNAPGNAPQEIFTGLTDEQLHQLEGMERANVEARITLLRNIQKLLDTAVLQMNQYTSLMSSLEYPPGPGYYGYSSSPVGVKNHPAPDQPRPLDPDDKPTGGGDVASASFQRSQSLGNKLMDKTPNSVGFDVKDLTVKTDDLVKDEEDEDGAKVSEAELVRQRRLKRFHSVPVSASGLGATLPGSIKEKENEDNTA